jgi:single-strand DNA-binding protein
MNNQITLVGKVGNAPTSVTFTDSDNKLAKFSIAVQEFSSKKDNPDPMWIDVDAWGNLAERVLDHVTRGREVVVNGRLSIVKYNKEVNGVTIEIQKAVVKLSGFHLCGPKPKSEDAPAEKPTRRKRTAA